MKLRLSDCLWRAALVAACISSLACAAEIKVMTSGAFTAAYLELAPQYERATGNQVVTLATSMGAGQGSIPNRIRNGEAVDVVIMAEAALQELLRERALLRGSGVPIARSAIGMCVRAGAPKPDISTVNALRQTLLAAKSIAYSNSVSGQYLARELFPRLGIAEQVQGKCRRIERESTTRVPCRPRRSESPCSLPASPRSPGIAAQPGSLSANFLRRARRLPL